MEQLIIKNNITNIHKKMKGLNMLNRKSKEQLISLLLLGSVFIFFVYLKMNPESHSEYVESNSLNTQTKVHEMINQDVIEIDSYIIESSVSEEIDKSGTTEESITKDIDFTQKELTRAHKYLDRNWKPDDTINMNAWEHVKNNPIEIYKNQVVNNLK